MKKLIVSQYPISKLRSNNEIKNFFCTKNRLNNNKSNQQTINDLFNITLFIPNVTYFCKNIPNAIEIPKNLLNNNQIKLQNNTNKYYYFIANINFNNKTYRNTYAKQNKFTKCEIISIYLDKTVFT